MNIPLLNEYTVVLTFEKYLFVKKSYMRQKCVRVYSNYTHEKSKKFSSYFLMTFMFLRFLKTEHGNGFLPEELFSSNDYYRKFKYVFSEGFVVIAFFLNIR